MEICLFLKILAFPPTVCTPNICTVPSQVCNKFYSVPFGSFWAYKTTTYWQIEISLSELILYSMYCIQGEKLINFNSNIALANHFFPQTKNVLQCLHNWFNIIFSTAFSQEIFSNLPMFYKQVHIFREKEIELARMLLQKGFGPFLFREIAACQQMVQKK